MQRLLIYIDTRPGPRAQVAQGGAFGAPSASLKLIERCAHPHGMAGQAGQVSQAGAVLQVDQNWHDGIRPEGLTYRVLFDY